MGAIVCFSHRYAATIVRHFSLSASRLPAIALAALAMVHLAQIAHHVPWRDEHQPWLIASESRSLSELMFNMRFKGHSPLWQMLLMFVQQWASDASAIKFLQGAIVKPACRGASFSRRYYRTVCILPMHHGSAAAMST